MRKRSLLHLVALVAIALSTAIHPSTAEASSTIYVAGTGNEFGTLDLTTGVATVPNILNLPGGPTSDLMFAMGFSSGNLYGLDSSTPSANLYQINPSNGALGAPSAVGQTAIGGTTDNAGTMFVVSQEINTSVFYTLNPPSATPVTPPGPQPTGLFLPEGLVAVTASGSAVYATALNSNTGLVDLYSINETTGVATDIGPTSDPTGANFIPITGLFVNGTLYGFDANNDIVTINTSTGAVTLVGTVTGLGSGDYLTAVAAQSIPEPSSVVLGLIAAAAVGSVGLVRRKPSTTNA